jgi:cytochrome c556
MDAKTKTALGLALATILTAGPALAEAPENYIKYRQAVMSAIGGHMSASSQIVRGRVAPDGALAMHADALARLNADLAPLFPEGSDFGETKARESIWEDWQGFMDKADAARDATAAFAEAVASGDADSIQAAHRDVGRSCKGCHEDFRIKDD